MFMRRPLFVFLACLAGNSWCQELPGLGEPVSADELSMLDYTVLPDGTMSDRDCAEN